MGWGVSPDATNKEKLKAEMADYLNGLNSTGVISYEVYSEDNCFEWWGVTLTGNQKTVKGLSELMDINNLKCMGKVLKAGFQNQVTKQLIN